jgi:16S rRNA (cytidine1402-2'-O)-methyltransferase
MLGEAASSSESTLAPGLYVVGTPIGNLEDVTLRALRVLKEADLIACEDTRQTRKLLDRYGIGTATVSYHEHNEAARAAELMVRLQAGARLALVTDAGTPGISDPGYRLIALAAAGGVPVFPIPGPSATIAALVGSGLPMSEFGFRGFLPSKQGQRQEALEAIRESTRTEIFYEAPHRIRECMQDVVKTFGPERAVVVAREITKVHEEFIRGTAAAVLERITSREPKGEITLLIGRAEAGARGGESGAALLRDRVERLMAEENVDAKTALKRVAREMGVSRSEAYRALQRGKK